jgi:hypothetical protein
MTVGFRRWDERQPEDKDSWRIFRWRMNHLKVIEAPTRLFDEVLDAALPDPESLSRARRSLHEEMVVEALTNKDFVPPHKWFKHQSQDRHPAVSVVDLDGDGWDDLYIVAEWGKNMLLRNRGDGTFEEEAARWGLDIEDHSTCAIFADLDNDGDKDAFIGRSLARSMLLENEGGHFVDRSNWVDEDLPFLVSSAAAVDYDLDGMLDIYVSTYAANMTRRSFEENDDLVLAEYIPEEDARHLRQMMLSDEYHVVLNKPGPPNILMRNEGSLRMRFARENTPLFLFMNTYQTTWADYDADGDPDLYCSNDFGPNSLFRNDLQAGFVDVTAETGTADIGFGMGSSWGDYDNDGRQDLYVANMFSKAGRRITDQVPGLDPRFALMARGNSLFRNEGAFKKVSGLEPPAMMVENGGWSWGGQFVDLDNDSFLDIYTLSGYYTAPKEFAEPIDT